MWGGWYFDLFERAMLPSLLAALAKVDGPWRFIVHTNDTVRVQKIFEDYLDRVEILELAVGVDQYVCFGEAHKEGLRLAQVDEVVCLLPADVIVSQECFAACEQRFAFRPNQPQIKVVGIHGFRTLIDPAMVKGPMLARNLLDLGIRYMHPTTHHSFWHVGFSGHNSAVYFAGRYGITAHVFHLHPFAIVKEEKRPTFRERSTADQHLLEDYADEEIHIVTHPDEMAVVEISPPWKQHPHAPHLFVNQPRVLDWATGANRVTEQECRFFARAITLWGEADGSQEESAVKEILAEIRQRL